MVDLLGSMGFPVLRDVLVVALFQSDWMVLAVGVQMFLMSHHPMVRSHRSVGMMPTMVGCGMLVFGKGRGKRRSGDQAEGAGGGDRKGSETGCHDEDLSQCGAVHPSLVNSVCDGPLRARGGEAEPSLRIRPVKLRTC